MLTAGQVLLQWRLPQGFNFQLMDYPLGIEPIFQKCQIKFIQDDIMSLRFLLLHSFFKSCFFVL